VGGGGGQANGDPPPPVVGGWVGSGNRLPPQFRSLTRALAYLVRMVDLINMSRHDPTVRPQRNASIVLPAREY
jgi:hypothetical protein